MSFSIEEGIFTVSLTAIATVALGLLMLLFGQAIKNRIEFLKKYCIPAPVVGGVLVDWVLLVINTTMINMFG